ncbi:MAG: DUF853 family protein [Micrococcus sp.]|nr:DUF853 family protein [Micrococcus sp.]
MASHDEHLQSIRAGYDLGERPSITLGAANVGDTVHADTHVRLPLSMMNRHGLIAGATGTGKTKTLQGIAEQLSENGVPVFLADIKGDLSGLATPGEPSEKLLERTASVGMDWQPTAFPVEFLALGGDGVGVPVRATIDSFGPLLLARVMGLNETQETSLQLMFHWADQRELPLDDLKDLKAVVSYLTSDEGKAELKEIGGVATSTANVILRQLTALEAGGMDAFFGVPEFDTAELLRLAPDGRGVISCLELPTLQSKPQLFSTFMIWLLADLFAELPEAGDLDKPKLVFFIDEAHLVFKGASKAFLDSITTTVRLIRSKGVGLFFVTQTPQDVPAEVLGQLANRVQHALRAFTPQDATALKATVRTFPTSDYDLETVLTSAKVGEAVVTVMDPDGAPTPVALTRMWAPRSLMDPSTPATMEAVLKASDLMEVYGEEEDRESAFEMLAAQKAAAESAGAESAGRAAADAGAGPVPTGSRARTGHVADGRADHEHGIDAAAREMGWGEDGDGAGSGERRRRVSDLDAEPARQTRTRSSGTASRKRTETQARSDFDRALGNFMKSAGTQLGREVMRSAFGTKRRKGGGLLGKIFG